MAANAAQTVVVPDATHYKFARTASVEQIDDVPVETHCRSALTDDVQHVEIDDVPHGEIPVRGDEIHVRDDVTLVLDDVMVHVEECDDALRDVRT